MRSTRIADVDTAIEFPVKPRSARGAVNDVAAVIKISMRAGAASLKMADLRRPGRLIHIEDEETFGRGLTLGPAPAGSNAFQAGDHLAFGDLDLNRPGIFRTGNVSAIIRRRRIGNIDDTP